MRCSLFKRGVIWQTKVKLDTWTKERRYSLETKDKRVAHAKQQKLVQELEADEQGWGAPRSARDAATMPLAALVVEWLDELTGNGLAASTVLKYKAALRKVCTAGNWERLAHISAGAFVQWRKDCGLRAKTVNDYLAACSRFGGWLTLKRMLRENPFAVVGPVETRTTEREYRAGLTCAQLQALLAASPQPRRVIYQLIAETGARRTEMKRLRWGDFCLTDVPSVTIPASISKNRKARVFPLSPEVAAQLRARKPADAAPFQCPFAHAVPRISTLRRDLSRAGIPFVDEMDRRRDLHSLRKTFGTALLLAGESPYVVMHAMRHSDLKLTMKLYRDAQQFEQPLADAIGRLPWRAKEVGRAS